MLTYAISIHADEAFFAAGAGRDDAELVRRDDADTTALHLLKEAGGLNIAHEEDALDGLDVRAGGDHVYRETCQPEAWLNSG
ncbi:MAG: hypothetical protein JWQ49_5248 [Edaphobacter sp.]|nr:hypothetical protein [Edaphobacter sp.]